ncbi:MAG: hypothetical protein Q8Q15_04515 [bacterium]|nr:hypothetical protein [bacterium]
MEELPLVAANNTRNKSGLIFFALLMLLLGFLLGFGADRLLLTKKPQNFISTIAQPLPQNIDESKLPVSLSLLQNPIVYEWRGSVKGKVIAKEPYSFTLEDDKKNRITITDRTPSGGLFRTAFLKKTASTWEETSSSAVSVGSNLTGDFFIFKGGKNTPIGSSFNIEE